jgi:hypothetical protein
MADKETRSFHAMGDTARRSIDVGRSDAGRKIGYHGEQNARYLTELVYKPARLRPSPGYLGLISWRNTTPAFFMAVRYR